MIYKKGNLITMALAGEFDVIVHGCNCFGNWDKGIAVAMKSAFPEAFQKDRNTLRGYSAKLGNFTKVEYPSLIVLNAYTQFKHYDTVDYNALERVMKRIGKEFPAKRIGLPKIGAGMAKGDWSKIETIIDTNVKGCIIVEYSQTK